MSTAEQNDMAYLMRDCGCQHKRVLQQLLLNGTYGLKAVVQSKITVPPVLFEAQNFLQDNLHINSRILSH